jgi:hypothetical protein
VLTWSSTNATACTASGGWSGSKSTSGSHSVTPARTTTYTLACTGSGGNVTKDTTISVGIRSTQGHNDLGRRYRLPVAPSSVMTPRLVPPGRKTATLLGTPALSGKAATSCACAGPAASKR